MARTTIASLETKIAALEARLQVATEVYRNQRARIAELEAQLAARGAAKVIPQRQLSPRLALARDAAMRTGSVVKVAA